MSEDRKYSWLFYGEEGTGKSYILASALVDITTGATLREGVIHDYEGRLEHLGIPKEFIKDLRPPFGKPDRVVGALEQWMTAHFRKLAQNQGGPEVIGADSLSEAQFLLRLGMAQAAADESSKEDEEVLSQRGWGKLHDRMALNIGYLHPSYTKAHFLATAYVEEARGPLDSEDIQKRPQLQGQLGRRLGKYFDFVVFVEKRQVKVGDERKIVHRYHFTTNGDFLSKNILEHKGVLPAYLDNPTFDDILACVNKA